MLLGLSSVVEHEEDEPDVPEEDPGIPLSPPDVGVPIYFVPPFGPTDPLEDTDG